MPSDSPVFKVKQSPTWYSPPGGPEMFGVIVWDHMEGLPYCAKDWQKHTIRWSVRGREGLTLHEDTENPG